MPAFFTDLDGDIGVMTFCLQQSYGGNHGRDDKHLGNRMRQHLLDDLLGLLRKMVMLDQRTRLLFGRGMAT